MSKCTCTSFSHKEPLVIHQVLNALRYAPFCQAWDQYGSSLRCLQCSVVPRIYKEVCILRMAHVKKLPYVKHIHEKMALDLGLDKSEIQALSNWQEKKDLFCPKMLQVLQLTDDFLEEKYEHPALIQDWGLRYYFELVVVIGFYLNVGCVTRALDLQPESQMVTSRL